jgi:ribosomal protein S18 acetylase RimI-like enzyme
MLGPDDVQRLLDAGHLFDEMPTDEFASMFLEGGGSHCLIAYVEGTAAGFVTGIELRHPDKAPEMLLYELGVDPEFRGRGIGRSLVAELQTIAAERGYRGMWVLTEEDNEPAIATYRSSGARDPETALLFEW